MLFSAILIILAFVLEPSRAGLTSVIDLGYARYRGILDLAGSNNTQFLGIRFAAPPTDCLFLNVYTPGQLDSRSSGKNLPVVVWIHGGGCGALSIVEKYVSGGANGFSGPDAYNGNDLVRESGDGVVTVVIQYRLGLFGFLAGKAVKAEGGLNAGLLDQQFALQWVQTHVALAQFLNVRRLPSSAGIPAESLSGANQPGAGSVLQQVIANDGKTFPPLFRAAITSSTFLPSQYAFNDVVPEFLYNSVVSKSNCTSAANSLACLRSADVVDGDFIKQRPALALVEGKVNGVSSILVLGSSNRSGHPHNGRVHICLPYFLLRAFQGRSAFKASQKFNKRSEDVVDIELNQGQFAIPPATHGMDVAYYFPSINADGVPPFNNTDFDKAFAESFLAFAMSLDPNQTFEPTTTPDWKPFSFQQGHQKAASLRYIPFTTPEDLLDRCSFWESVGPEIGHESTLYVLYISTVSTETERRSFRIPLPDQSTPTFFCAHYVSLADLTIKTTGADTFSHQHDPIIDIEVPGIPACPIIFIFLA
ncbi:Alpha/Beta hydrolase protein [Armillaria mellea]|nr:Alpha/Beta hydrolase protein [Armillaria mellea]